jgi:hypothetical protein
MTESLVYVLRTFLITEDAWTAIVTPIACSYWGLRPTGNVLLRSDEADEDTEDSLAANAQEGCTSSWNGPTVTRYRRNETVILVKSAVGAGPVTLKARFVK